MIDELLISKDLEGNGRGLVGALSWDLHGGIEETHENPQVRTADILAEIQTEHLPNASLDHYR
jgi:hypothetical protein